MDKAEARSLLERCLPTSSPGSLYNPVDLIVRTSGEKRLSDFLLWQSASCPVAFTRVLWPELSLFRFLLLLLRFQRAHPYFAQLGGKASPAGGDGAADADADAGCGGGCARMRPDALARAASLLLPPLMLCALERLTSIDTHSCRSGGQRCILRLVRELG